MNYKVLVVSVALILPTACLVEIGQPKAADAGEQRRAIGTLTTMFPSPDIAQRTQGDLFILSRYAVNTYLGSLEGTTVALQTVVRDDVVEKKAFHTNTGIFWGTLDGFEPGSFSFIVHNVVDRSGCPCPPGLTPFEGKFVVVEGTGSGGLEGICGSGIVKTGIAGTEYDYTFQFGKHCKTND
jgi:hypothetical protein